MKYAGVLVSGSVGDEHLPIGQGAIVTCDVETVDEACAWLQAMTAANAEWRVGLIVPSELLDKTMGSLRNDAHRLLREFVVAADQLREAVEDPAADEGSRAVMMERLKTATTNALDTAYPDAKS